MSANSCEYEHNSNPIPGLLLLVILAWVAYSALPVIFGTHAVARHGDDARAIRRCNMDQGPRFVFRAGDTYYLLCQLDDERWGLQAVKKGYKNLYNELTAFVKGKGTYRELMAYMQRIGATRVEKLPGILLPAFGTPELWGEE
jgi:hypothetical protein